MMSDAGFSRVDCKDFHNALRLDRFDDIRMMTNVHLPEGNFGEEYENHMCFLSPSRHTGFAISPNGELCSLWSKEGQGRIAVATAILLGARHLNCFDGYLVDFYSKLGFHEYKREPNWTEGQPDVVFMKLGRVANLNPPVEDE